MMIPASKTVTANRMGWVIDLAISFGLIGGLFAQSNGHPPRPPQNHVTVPEARQIVASSMVATERSWRARDQYTYLGRDEDRRLDAQGRVKSEDVAVSRTIVVNGVSVKQLLEHNGRAPTADDQRKLQEKAAQRRKEQQNWAFIQEVPAAFDFQLLGEEAINSRPAYILHATPHAGYQAHTEYGKMFANATAKIWVDKQDYGWVKIDAQIIQPFAMGSFMVRVQRGSHIMLEQTRVGEGIWMPKRIEVRGSAKILYVMNYEIERIMTYSDYRPAQAGLTATGPSAGLATAR